MPRPRQEDLVDASDVRLNPLLDDRAGALLRAETSFVHYSDSTAFRAEIMEAVGFPRRDIASFLIVNHLSLRGAMRPTDLAEALQTSRPNVTRLVQGLVDEGLVARVVDPSDDRGILIGLSADGERYGRALIRYEKAWMPRLLSHWDPDDLETFTTLFVRMVHDVGASLPPEVARAFAFPVLDVAD